MNILVVDDNRSIREMHVELVKKLDPMGNVFAARDGSEALGILHEKSIKLIITDIRMEPMSGLELIREVRKSKPDLAIFVLASNPKDLEEAKRIGATRTFEKGTGDAIDMFDWLKERLKSGSSAE